MKAATGAMPAERANAAIVMVCGEADGLWPSCPLARAVAAPLRAARYRHPVTLLAYPDAGHAAFGPPADPGGLLRPVHPRGRQVAVADVRRRDACRLRVFAATGPALFGFGAGVVMRREQGLIELKRVSPMPARAYVAATLALALIDAFALIAGVRLSAGSWAALTLIHLASSIPSRCSAPA